MYHMLGVSIVIGTARVSIAVVLAVDYSALYSFLYLMDRGKNVRKWHSNHSLCRKQPITNNFLFNLNICHLNVSSLPLYAGCSEP